MGRVRWRAVLVKCPFCDDGILLEYQTTGPFPERLDSSGLVGAVDLCASTERTDLSKI